jgi:hypothetical protein
MKELAETGFGPESPPKPELLAGLDSGRFTEEAIKIRL